MVRIGPAMNDVPIRGRCIPGHDTAKGLRILLHVMGHQRPNLGRGYIPRSRKRIAGEANVKLSRRIGTLLDNLHPLVIIEAIAMAELISTAGRVVIELNPNKIERSIRNCIAELNVRGRALGCTRNIEPLVRVVGETLTQSIDHGCVPCESQ